MKTQKKERKNKKQMKKVKTKSIKKKTIKKPVVKTKPAKNKIIKKPNPKLTKQPPIKQKPSTKTQILKSKTLPKKQLPKKQILTKDKKQIPTKLKQPQSQESLISSISRKSQKKTEKIERVVTGIKNFDSLIQGGFEKNSTNLLVGCSGSGKSIFAVQFLIEGMRKKEKCLYVTFEEKKSEFYSNMLTFGWDLEKLEKQGLFYFLEYTPEKVRTMLEEGGGAIENIVLTKQISRIVIDSITSFELLFEKPIEKRESALALFGMIRKWDCTSLLTYEDSPSPGKKITSRILDFESDGIILLYFVRGKEKRNRFLEVVKMRGTNHSLEIYPFDISKSGITITKQKYTGDIF